MNFLEEKKSRLFFINTTSLFSIQIANYVLPFLLVPYLTRILGVETYGIAAFGLSIIQIACIFTDYGFNLSLTHEISVNRENRDFLNKIIGAVFICKLFLLVLVVLGILLYTFLQSTYREYQTFFLFLILPIIGQTFQPLWFFQGIEKMVPITIYTILSRILYLILVILFVTSPQDLRWVVISNGIAHIIAACVGGAIVYRMGYRPSLPEWKFIRTILSNSTEYFWSRAALASFTSGGAFFLGLFSTPIQIAYYSVAEQLYKGAQSVFAPISQSLYPHMVKHKNFTLFFNTMKIVILVCVLGVITGTLFSSEVIQLIFGKGFEDSRPILIVFLIALLANTPSVLLGYPFLGAMGKAKLANRSVILAGILQITLLYYCYIMNLTNAFDIACIVTLIEILVLVLRITWARRYYIEYITLIEKD